MGSLRWLCHWLEKFNWYTPEKPWCLYTNGIRIIQFFSQYVCPGNHTHEETMGKSAKLSALYTKKEAEGLKAWDDSTVQLVSSLKSNARKQGVQITLAELLT